MSPFLKRVGILLSGNAGGQAVTLALSPILTRLYSPEAFGQFGVFLSLVAILSVLATLRFERGIVVARSVYEQRSLLFVIFLISAGFGLALILLTSMVPAIWLQGNNSYSAVLYEWGWLLGLAVTLTGFEIALRHLTLKRGLYGVMATSRFGHSCFQGGVQLGMGVGGIYSGLMTGAVVSLGFRVSWLSYRLVKDLKSVFRKRRVALLTAWKRNSVFPKYMIGASLCTSLISQGLMVFGGLLVPAATVGQLYLSHKMLVLPMSLVTRSVTDVNFKELAETDAAQIMRLYLSRVRRLARWGAGPFFCAFVLAPYLFPFVFGPEWRQAGRFVQLITPGLWVQFAISPFGPTFWVLNRHREFLFLSACRLVFLVAGMTIGFLILSEEGIAAGFSLGLIVGYTAQHRMLLAHLVSACYTPTVDER